MNREQMKIQRNPGSRHIVCLDLENVPVAALASHLLSEEKTVTEKAKLSASVFRAEELGSFHGRALLCKRLVQGTI